MSTKNISVIITTYNRPKLLSRALKSVLSQNHKPFEIIVVDDGSFCKLDLPQEIIYIKKQNGGISSARNVGIKRAKGELVAFLDDDDEWDIDKLKLQLAFHEKNNAVMSYTDEQWIKDGKIINIPKKYQKHDKNIFKKCLSHCFIAPSSVLINKLIFNEIGLFDEGLEVCEDYDMWLKISSKYPVHLLDLPLIKKHAGAKEQLGFKYWGMDRFRIKSLLNLRKIVQNADQKKAIDTEIKAKAKLLLKGAKKHNNKEMIKYYERLTLL